MVLNNSFYTITNKLDEDAVISYRVKLNADHEIYKAHFPGNPITPGVCLLQIVTELLKDNFDKNFTLLAVSNIKYLSVLSPLESPEVSYQLSKIDMGNGTCKLQALVSDDNNKYAKMSLVYIYE